MIRIRTMREFLWQISEQFGSAIAYSWKENNILSKKSYKELNDDVTRLA